MKMSKTITPVLASLTISNTTFAEGEKYNPLTGELATEVIAAMVKANDDYFAKDSESPFKSDWEQIKVLSKREKFIARYNPDCTLSFGIDGRGQVIIDGPMQTQTLDGMLDNSERVANYASANFSATEGYSWGGELTLDEDTTKELTNLCSKMQTPEPKPESKPEPTKLRPTPKEEYKAFITLDGRAMVSHQQEPAAIPCAGLTALAAFGNDVLVKDGKALAGLSLTGCRSQLSESYEEARMSVPGKTDVLRTYNKEFTTGYYINPELSGGFLVPLTSDVSLGWLLSAGPQLFMQFQETSREQGAYNARGDPLDSAPGAIKSYTQTDGANLDITFGPKVLVTYQSLVVALGGGYVIPIVRAGEGADPSQGYGQVSLGIGFAPKGKKSSKGKK